ncbi:MTERF3 [Branchiostoma lanceolatum]|uniref:mTERF3 protein n=1 Tax=Branchiostoma lanceolatum TaxID=7740 RepID=A0A8K0EZY6_BRALA|nr:MTERF3 [Branchiostoma lanceolatum]
MGHRVLTYEEVTCAFRWNRGICEGRRCAISTETGHRGKLVECVVHVTKCEANSSSHTDRHGEQRQDPTWRTEDDESVAKYGQATTGTSECLYRNCSNDSTGDELECDTNKILQSEHFSRLSPSSSESLCGAQGTDDSSALPRNNHSSSPTALDFVEFPAAQTPAGGDLELDDLEETDIPSVERQQAYRGPVQQAYVGLRKLVDHSETLQKLVHLGVDLHKVSKKRHAANLIAKLDFDSQVKEKLMFLLDVGVAKEDLGGVISVNPFILGVELERLERRVQYLMSKKFKKEEIGKN